jgi:DNA-binding winged helix-turn-helix (wHTH) protein/tetratricopeptide (TPR) repeat protein
VVHFTTIVPFGVSMASPAHPSLVIRFGEFDLVAATGELRKAGLPLKIHPQPFRVLLLLAERSGQIVTREEIRRCLWGDNTFVDFEGGINFCVKQIREVLADDAENPRYLQTIPRRGYRFIAPISHAPHRDHILSFPLPYDSGDPVRPSFKPAADSLSSTEIHAIPSPHPLPLPPSPPLLDHRNPWNSKLIPAAIATIFVLALLAAGAVFYFHRAPKLTEKDTVVIADFNNTTGDPVFDDALKQGLAMELGQSLFLNLLPARKINDTLRMMGRTPGDHITPDMAREICLRTGSHALLAGSISSLGSLYVVDLTASACGSGEILAKEEAQAARKEDVLKALSRAAASLRNRLGESLPSVQKFDVPIEATTTSLEALQLYSKSVRVTAKEGDAAAVPFLNRAIVQDPNFVTAYASLARRYSNLDQPSLAYQNAAKAYEHREHATDREKLSISLIYFRTIGDLPSLDQTFRVWMATYPHDSAPHGSLCINYQSIGQFQSALVECQEAVRLEPEYAVNVANVADIYLDLEQYDDAQKTCERSSAQKLLCSPLYYLAFLRRDSAEMAAQVSAAAGKPGVEDTLLTAQSDTEAYFGRLQEARNLSRRAVDSASRFGLLETAALWRVKEALWEAEFGHSNEAKRGVAEALKLAPGRDVMILGAIASARIGDAARARELTRQLQQSYPSNTMLKAFWLPVINAYTELHIGNYSKALTLLDAAAPYDLAQPSPNDTGTLYPVYLRGQAYLLAHNGTAASAEFQKVLDHPGIVANFCTGALAHLQFARAQALSGDSAKAKSAYEDFLALWKDADPDIPVLVAARSEYAKLK